MRQWGSHWSSLLWFWSRQMLCTPTSWDALGEAYGQDWSYNILRREGYHHWHRRYQDPFENVCFHASQPFLHRRTAKVHNRWRQSWHSKWSDKRPRWSSHYESWSVFEKELTLSRWREESNCLYVRSESSLWTIEDCRHQKQFIN